MAGVKVGEVETVEHTRDHGLGVTVYFGHRKGSASTSDLSEAAVRDTVQAACNIARHTQEDPCAGLADAGLMATEVRDLDLYHPWGLDADGAIDLALECENAARRLDPRIDNSEGATLDTHAGLRVYGNLRHLAKVTLRAGQSVVVDAVHARPEERAASSSIGTSSGRCA